MNRLRYVASWPVLLTAGVICALGYILLRFAEFIAGDYDSDLR